MEINQLKDEVRILKRKRTDLETENMNLNKKIKINRMKKSSKVLLEVNESAQIQLLFLFCSLEIQMI